MTQPSPLLGPLGSCRDDQNWIAIGYHEKIDNILPGPDIDDQFSIFIVLMNH